MMIKVIFAALLPLCLLLSSCDSARLFEENKDLENYVWPEKVQPVFAFEITDTTQAYDLFINVRNASAYQLQNLYVRHILYAPNGKELNRALHNLYLSNPKTGEPKGSGMGDIWDHQIRFIRNVKFTAPGKYSVKFQQYMRLDPLPGIMSVGLRVAEAQVPEQPK